MFVKSSFEAILYLCVNQRRLFMFILAFIDCITMSSLLSARAAISDARYVNLTCNVQSFSPGNRDEKFEILPGLKFHHITTSLVIIHKTTDQK